MSDLGLAGIGGRCQYGYAPNQHTLLCDCAEMGSWAVFMRAVRGAVCTQPKCSFPGVHVHQGEIRPHIKGRIDPKRIGTLYRQAKERGVLRQIGKEPSTDREGRNGHHDSPVYELRSAA